VKSNLRKIPGVVDIEDDFDAGKKEVKIVPYHEKLSIAGLTVAQIAPPSAQQAAAQRLLIPR
jgi:Cu/Ag efflux pump CusA